MKNAFVAFVAVLLLGVTSQVHAQSMRGDFDDDGDVHGGDLNMVLANWGLPGDPPPVGWINDLPKKIVGSRELNRVLANWGNVRSGFGDMDGDRCVGAADLNIVITNWGVDTCDVGPEWTHDIPQGGLVGGAELNRVLANWGNKY